MNDREFHRHTRHVLMAWAALIALMLASLASAYVPLGLGNFVAGAVIAIIKAAIVAGLFMGLARSETVIRIVAATALATWLLLLLLGGVDNANRPAADATYQSPQQVHAGGTETSQ
jgi:caa(3)-type oxidase subunit IV